MSAGAAHPDPVVAAVGAWPRDADVVRRAVVEAAVRGVPLTLLHVDDGRSGPDGGHEGAHVREGSPLAEAEALARTLRPDVPVHTAVDPGSVVGSIVRASESADLVVLGSEGAPPRAKLVRGAVTANVATRSRCRAEVVPVPGPGPAVPPTRVVAVVTGEHGLDDLCGEAFAEAERLRAGLEFWLVRGEDPGDSAATPPPADQRVRARRRLQALLAPWLRASPTVPCDVVVVTGGLKAVLRCLEETDLVVTLRGRGARSWGRPDGWGRALVERARCPVVVVPGPELHHRTEEAP
jgi:nucleotide-binding universal stress UspA family protein